MHSDASRCWRQSDVVTWKRRFASGPRSASMREPMSSPRLLRIGMRPHPAAAANRRAPVAVVQTPRAVHQRQGVPVARETTRLRLETPVRARTLRRQASTRVPGRTRPLQAVRRVSSGTPIPTTTASETKRMPSSAAPNQRPPDGRRTRTIATITTLAFTPDRRRTSARRSRTRAAKLRSTTTARGRKTPIRRRGPRPPIARCSPWVPAAARGTFQRRVPAPGRTCCAAAIRLRAVRRIRWCSAQPSRQPLKRRSAAGDGRSRP